MPSDPPNPAARLACATICTPLVPDPPSVKPPPITHVSQKAVRVIEPGSWPVSSPVLCWHCCHPFDTPPLPMPTRYDDRLDTFHVVGYFCSWGCMKTYNLEARSYMRDIQTGLIHMFHRGCTGRERQPGIRPAPPRLALKAFGGHMGIEEFRGCDKILDIAPPKMILHIPVVEEIPARLRDKPTAKQLEDTVCFKDTTTQNDMLRLRRPKPLQSHNLLVRTMGVQILQGAQA